MSTDNHQQYQEEIPAEIHNVIRCAYDKGDTYDFDQFKAGAIAMYRHFHSIGDQQPIDSKEGEQKSIYDEMYAEACSERDAVLKHTEFQNKVREWLVKCFGEGISNDKVERNFRFLEEALELVQSLDCSKDSALALVEYVYGRPIGDIKQECGGVMVTLAALCHASGISMIECGLSELDRVWGKIDQIRVKQAAKKIKSGPLP